MLSQRLGMEQLRDSMSRSVIVPLGTLLIGFSVGCGNSERVAAPKFDPAAIASGALAAYDANSDGEIDKKEYKSTPFGYAPDRWDADSSDSISEQEILERLEKYVEKATGLMDVTVIVTLNGRPVQDALVEFIPEDFMGGVVEAAEATTDIDGRATPAIPEVVAEDPVLTGLRPGLYKIKVTHTDLKIPPKYNEDTTLGFDASPLDVVFSAVPLKLRK